MCTRGSLGKWVYQVAWSAPWNGKIAVGATNVGDRYPELVPFDGALAQRMTDRAVKVITATEAGELLPRSFNDPTHFECRMCAWQDRCWRTPT